METINELFGCLWFRLFLRMISFIAHHVGLYHGTSFMTGILIKEIRHGVLHLHSAEHKICIIGSAREFAVNINY